MDRRGFIKFLVAAPVTKALPWQSIANFIAPIAPETSVLIGLTLEEIISVTLKARMPEIVANIQANNALLRRLKELGQVKPFEGNDVG